MSVWLPAPVLPKSATMSSASISTPSGSQGLNDGIVPIFEPGLDEMVLRNRRAGRLQFTTDGAPKPSTHGEVIFIAVGTPPLPDGSSDLQYVDAVARTIGPARRPAPRLSSTNRPCRSAPPIACAGSLPTNLSARGVEIEIDVVSNPEFLKEGAAIDDFMKPDRIIVGTDTEHGADVMRELYAPFNRNHQRMLVMDVRSAEFTKYAANAMLATKISFMNELANIAERVGVDIESVRIGIGSDPRIGYSFIYPGCGYGGSCFPKDVRSLERTAAGVGYDAQLLRAVEEVNDRQKQVLFGKVSDYFDGDLAGKQFAVWGLAFKPNTDDMRDAPSRTLMESLWASGATGSGIRPRGDERSAPALPGRGQRRPPAARRE